MLRAKKCCAVSPRDQKAAKRLIDAKCNPYYVRKQSRLMLDPTESSDGEASPFKNFSNLSHARARAANPLLDFAMRRKFAAHFKNLQQSGKLRNGQPEANQVWSVDEIGIDVQGGCWPEFFSLVRHHGIERSFRERRFRALAILGESNSGDSCLGRHAYEADCHSRVR